jgi:hypothetical protein
MTTDDVLALGEELRQQGVDDGGGLWAMAEYVDWLVEHGEALMRISEENARLRTRIAELEEESATRDADYGPLLQRVLDFVSRDDVQAVAPEAEDIAQQIRWRLPAS